MAQSRPLYTVVSIIRCYVGDAHRAEDPRWSSANRMQILPLCPSPLHGAEIKSSLEQPVQRAVFLTQIGEIKPCADRRTRRILDQFVQLEFASMTIQFSRSQLCSTPPVWVLPYCMTPLDALVQTASAKSRSETSDATAIGTTFMRAFVTGCAALVR
jgi:hypothetical protein